MRDMWADGVGERDWMFFFRGMSQGQVIGGEGKGVLCEIDVSFKGSGRQLSMGESVGRTLKKGARGKFPQLLRVDSKNTQGPDLTKLTNTHPSARWLEPPNERPD